MIFWANFSINLKLKSDEIEYLKEIKKAYYPEKETKDEYTNDKFNDENYEMNDGYFSMNYPNNINSYWNFLIVKKFYWR